MPELNLPQADQVSIHTELDWTGRQFTCCQISNSLLIYSTLGDAPWGIIQNNPVGPREVANVARHGITQGLIAATVAQFDLLGPDVNGHLIHDAEGRVTAQESGDAGDVIDVAIEATDSATGGGKSVRHFLISEVADDAALAAISIANLASGSTAVVATSRGQYFFDDILGGWRFDFDYMPQVTTAQRNALTEVQDFQKIWVIDSATAEFEPQYWQPVDEPTYPATSYPAWRSSLVTAPNVLLRQDPDPANKAGRTPAGSVTSGFESYPTSNKLKYHVVNTAWVWDDSYIPTLANEAEMNAITEHEDGMVVRFFSTITADLNDGQGSTTHEHVMMLWTTTDGWKLVGRKDLTAVPTPVAVDSTQDIPITDSPILIDYALGNFVRLTGTAVAPFEINVANISNMPEFSVMKITVELAQGQAGTHIGFDTHADEPVLGVAKGLYEIERTADEYIISFTPVEVWT